MGALYQFQQAVRAEEEKQQQWVFEHTVKSCVSFLEPSDAAALAMCSKSTLRSVRVATIEAVMTHTKAGYVPPKQTMPQSAPLQMISRQMCLLSKQKKRHVDPIYSAAVSSLIPVQTAYASLINWGQTGLDEMRLEQEQLESCSEEVRKSFRVSTADDYFSMIA